MRTTAGFLVILFLTTVFEVRAEEPPPATAAASDAANTPVSASQPAATSGDAASAGAETPAPTPSKVAITVTADPAAPTPEDKEWLSRGYKLEVRGGEKYFCRREAQIGSRFETKQCTTAVALRAQRESAEEALRRIQSNRPSSGN